MRYLRDIKLLHYKILSHLWKCITLYGNIKEGSEVIEALRELDLQGVDEIHKAAKGYYEMVSYKKCKVYLTEIFGVWYSQCKVNLTR